MEPQARQVPRASRFLSSSLPARSRADNGSSCAQVLDQADRLLTPTFAPELSFIIDQLPSHSERQTLLFTATVTDPVLALQAKPQAPGKPKVFTHVSRDMITTPAGLTQRYVFIPSQVRETYLTYLLLHLTELTGAQPLHAAAPPVEDSSRGKRNGGGGGGNKHSSTTEADSTPSLPQTILFVAHCRTAALLHSLFSSLPSPIPCTALHSHLSQAERLSSLATFRRQAVPLLIATDVGSRGLDIPEVAVVVNWEVPRVADDYVHRVGRTARAGRKGTAVTFVTEGDVELVQGLEERIGTQLEELELPEEPVLELLSAVSMAKRMANMVRSLYLSLSPSPPLLPPSARQQETDALSLVARPQDLSKDGFGARKENNRKKHGGGAAREGNKSAQAAGKGGAVKGKRAGAGAGAGTGKKGSERVRSERGAQARVEKAL